MVPRVSWDGDEDEWQKDETTAHSFSISLLLEMMMKEIQFFEIQIVCLVPHWKRHNDIKLQRNDETIGVWWGMSLEIKFEKYIISLLPWIRHRSVSRWHEFKIEERRRIWSGLHQPIRGRHDSELTNQRARPGERAGPLRVRVILKLTISARLQSPDLRSQWRTSHRKLFRS